MPLILGAAANGIIKDADSKYKHKEIVLDEQKNDIQSAPEKQTIKTQNRLEQGFKIFPRAWVLTSLHWAN